MSGPVGIFPIVGILPLTSRGSLSVDVIGLSLPIIVNSFYSRLSFVTHCTADPLP